MENKQKKKEKGIPNWYIDIMRDYLWPFYHKWILHKGRYGYREWLVECGHQNPYHILTPRLLKRQFENAKDMEI